MNSNATDPNKRTVILASVGIAVLIMLAIALPVLAPEYRNRFQGLGAPVSLLTFLVIAHPFAFTFMIGVTATLQLLFLIKYTGTRSDRHLKVVKVFVLLDVLVLMIIVGSVYAPIFEMGSTV